MKLKYFLWFILGLLIIFGFYLFLGKAPVASDISWGVVFSQKHSQYLGLDWKENYLALLEDLKVKNVKLAAYWDLIEPERDNYNFDDLDWQVKQAEEKGAKILLVIGMKVPRWPECHIPDWAKGLNKEEQKNEILQMLRALVLRYKDSPAIYAWQVENEPFFPFGECPWVDADFLKQEVTLVKSLDQDKQRPVVISDAGEFPLWLRAASVGDIVGITMYKRAFFSQLNFYIYYPFPPVYYWRKAQIVKALFQDQVICVELQAEPWCKNQLYNCSLEEQKRTMDLEKFKYNIEFAKNTGLDRFYLWGSEWWYWLKEKHNQPQIWQEAQKLF